MRLRNPEKENKKEVFQGNFCLHCSAWRGEFGLEPTPELYVRHVVDIFREVRRVLRDDGTLWLNLGDSYASGKGTCNNPGGGKNSLGRDRKAKGVHPLDRGNISILKASNLKPKDLIGMPWRVAFALQADGWYLRSDIIWHKPNPMPESVRDRCTKSHEYIFLLTKSKRYYFDQEAVREPFQGERWGGDIYKIDGNEKKQVKGLGRPRDCRPNKNGRNIRTVWTIATEPFPGSHFATFPQKLISPMVLAGTSEKGCCPKCGVPWKRIVKKYGVIQQRWKPGASIISAQYGSVGKTSVLATGLTALRRTTGWKPSCKHKLNPIPCIVLDPFIGSGTTAIVAKKLGRGFVGIELKPAYVRMAKKRIKQEVGSLSMKTEDCQAAA
jgi:DNA modification methylase